jgi:hypothetical protein
MKFQAPFEADTELMERSVWVTEDGRGRIEKCQAKYEDRTVWRCYLGLNDNGVWVPVEWARTYRTRNAAETVLKRALEGKKPLARPTKAKRAAAKRLTAKRKRK